MANALDASGAGGSSTGRGGGGGSERKGLRGSKSLN